MLIISDIVTCLSILLLIESTKTTPNCTKTDLNCYYTKECSRDANYEIVSQKYKPIIKEVSEYSEEMASNRLFRPRSALARALYEKQLNDRHLQEYDKNEWYRVENSRLTQELQDTFVQLHADDETREFLSTSIDKSSWVWTQIWYLLAKTVLRRFWSTTDINGWLGRGSMFVLSTAQARALLRPAKSSIEGVGTMVDIGAGDGEVSRRFAHLYGQKHATEISVTMRKSLSSKGYTVLDTEDWWRGEQFDCVCMLNLLDRCSKPRTMLQQARTAIKPDGVLLLALVLPFKPYVEVTADHKPEERLPIQGANFEEQVSSFVAVMRQAGFELSSWARAPYLCEGDFAQAYYWLDDSVYVFKPTTLEAAHFQANS